MVEHNQNVRLVSLDAWERTFIRDLIKHELTLSLHVPEENDVATLRLLDLLNKVDPVYPSRRDEDGNVVELN